MIPAPVIVKVPPKAITPEPELPAKVMLELDKEVFAILVIVLLAPETVLFVRISVVEAVIYAELLVH